MQLRQAVPFGVLDQHHDRIRHIHAHLHHRGGNQNVQLSSGEIRHHRFLFLGLHTAVQYANAVAGHPFRAQPFRILRNRCHVVFALFDGGADDVALQPLIDVLLHIAESAHAFGTVNGIGFDLLATGRKFIQD